MLASYFESERKHFPPCRKSCANRAAAVGDVHAHAQRVLQIGLEGGGVGLHDRLAHVPLHRGQIDDAAGEAELGPHLIDQQGFVVEAA